MTRLDKKSLLVFTLIVVLAGCATQPVNEYPADAPGFFSGLWHGLVLPISIVFSFFGEIRIYAFPNSGWFYDLGFVIGAGFSILMTLAVVAES